jgi:hypothetical protein
MTIVLPARERRIHVLSVTDDGPRLARQTYLSQLTEPPADATPLRRALGAEVDETYAEVFAVADIAPMRLRDYLAQAHDVPADAMGPEIDAPRGDVVVLAPRALEGLDRLDPVAGLRHIGAYPTPEADAAPRELSQAARAPGIATPATSTGTPVQKTSLTWIVMGALVLAAVLVLLLT